MTDTGCELALSGADWELVYRMAQRQSLAVAVGTGT